MSTTTAPTGAPAAHRGARVADGASVPRSRAARLVRGRVGDPAWARPALLALLAGTALLYLVGLSRNGYANSFYSAAVQAGSANWEAFFFGSSDAANSITVDKPPASLWVMALSVRLFGLSSWSILVPQALMGVATVGIVWASVQRRFGHGAGLLAGAALALTPVAALMFRFNNPDALLVLLMAAATAAVLRAVDNGRTRWLVLAGVLLGFGFLTKQLQVLLVVPGLGLAHLVAGPARIGRRVLQVLAGLVALVVSAGWYLAVVELVPASMRPYIGGSQDNSILELTLGYNGLGRLTGDETGSVGGGGGGNAGGGMWGATGITRLFTGEFGTQIAWLLPAALVLLVGGLAAVGRAPRVDGRRASFIAWGGWLLVTGLTFSFAQGIIHQYYTVALAPAVGALVGSGAAVLWRRRDRLWASSTLGAAVAVTAVTSFLLLGQAATFLPWLRWLVLVGGLAAGAVLAVSRFVVARVALGAAAVTAVLAGLAGPAAFAVQTAGTSHTGSIVTAGPQVAGGGFGPGGAGRRGARAFGGGGGQGFGPQGGTGTGTGTQGGTGTRGFGGQGFGTPGGTGIQGFGAQGGTGPQGGTGTQGFGAPGGTGTQGGGMPGGAGGLLNAATPSAELTQLLLQDSSSYTWVAAAVGSQSASGYQLATEQPVMPIGGFNGSDPSPTLAGFQQDVAQGRIHYFIASGFGGGGLGGAVRGGGTTQGGTTRQGGGTSQMGGSRASSEIASWVAANFTAQTVGGVTLYDLTSPAGSGADTTAASGTAI